MLYGRMAGGHGVIAVSSRWEYRRLAAAVPRSTDTVREIGCSTGAATTALASSARSVVAVDVAHNLVAELATRAEAGAAITHHALRRFLDGGDAVREVTMAKLATQRASFELHDRLLSLLGPDPELERAARDSRLGPIGGGSDEIMKEILGRTMGL